MFGFNFEFPYTNFHALNLDWIIERIQSTVKSVNNTLPDSEGNVNLPTVAGVSSVNGIGADGQGNVNLTPETLGFVSEAYYVDSSLGNDDNDGTTANTPFKTIGKAMHVYSQRIATANICTIYIKAGQYNEREEYRIPGSGNLSLCARDGEVTIAAMWIQSSGTIKFESTDPDSYGFKFQTMSQTPNDFYLNMINGVFEINCPLTFNCSGQIRAISTLLATIKIKDYGSVTCQNVNNNTCAAFNNSFLQCSNQQFTSNVTDIVCYSSVVMGMPSTITILGDYLST